MKTKTVFLLCSVLTIGNASAAVTFFGTNGTLDFDLATGSFIKEGIEVTLAANDGTVNSTAAGLGINATGGGDETAQLDTTNTEEILSFSFDQDVIFDSITLISVGINDALEASFNGAAPITLNTTGLQPLGTLLEAGDVFTLTAIDPNLPNKNNGIGITQFTVTAVPEPSSTLLIGLGSLAILIRRVR